jgi:signal transduction histidine kinase
MGEMVASIAHEVNQPLAAVVTNGNAALRWLHAAVPNLGEARTAIQRIVKEGNRASDVIGRIRALLKKKPPQMSALSINELIREVLTLARHEIQRREVSLRTELAEDLPVITGDPVQLQQVVLNLVLNAIEAASAKSEGPREVLLTSRHPEENGIVVAIHDSGLGIDPKDIDQLFKPFFTTKATGMGMGLSISRSMIESHGGRLWAEPRSGPGATFEFSLPAAGAALLPAVGVA